MLSVISFDLEEGNMRSTYSCAQSWCCYGVLCNL